MRGGQARAEINGVPKTYCNSGAPEFASATAEHLRVFVKEIALAKRPIDAAEHAREVLNLVFAGYQSANSGETVRLK